MLKCISHFRHNPNRSCKNCAHWWNNKFSTDEYLRETSVKDDYTKSTCAIDGAVMYSSDDCGWWTQHLPRGWRKASL